MRFRRGGQAIVLTKMVHSQKRRKDDSVSHLLTGSSQKNRSVMGLRWRSLNWDFPDTNPMSCSIMNNSYIPYLPLDSVYDLKVICWLRYQWFLIDLFYFVCSSILPACIYIHHMQEWCPWSSERVSDPLKLELQMVSAAMWILGTRSKSFVRAVRALNHFSNSSNY